MKTIDYVLLIIILAFVLSAVIIIVRKKRRGGSACSCGCQDCSKCKKDSGTNESNDI